MVIIVGCSDPYFRRTVAEILASLDCPCIRTHKLERILKELKQPKRFVILDASWEELEEPGVLKQLVNIGNISGNKVVCICPNKDEEIKKLVKFARPAKSFIRHDLFGKFKEYLKEKL